MKSCGAAETILNLSRLLSKSTHSVSVHSHNFLCHAGWIIGISVILNTFFQSEDFIWIMSRAVIISMLVRTEELSARFLYLSTAQKQFIRKQWKASYDNLVSCKRNGLRGNGFQNNLKCLAHEISQLLHAHSQSLWRVPCFSYQNIQNEKVHNRYKR